MPLVLNICIGLSAGLILGICASAIRQLFPRRYTEQQVERNRKIWKIISRFLTYFTGLLLLLGLIWTVYFLILGSVSPNQAEYANSMSELIVAVLTVVSIIFAFCEFIRRK